MSNGEAKFEGWWRERLQKAYEAFGNLSTSSPRDEEKIAYYAAVIKNCRRVIEGIEVERNARKPKVPAETYPRLVRDCMRGDTRKVVGARYGVSRERVRQILDKEARKVAMLAGRGTPEGIPYTREEAEWLLGRLRPPLGESDGG